MQQVIMMVLVLVRYCTVGRMVGAMALITSTSTGTLSPLPHDMIQVAFSIFIGTVGHRTTGTSKKPYRRNCPTYRAHVYYGFIPDLPLIKKLPAGRTNSRANSKHFLKSAPAPVCAILIRLNVG